jgi:deoxyribodipyrimidine photo-lyase
MQEKKVKKAIVWFRNDLRTSDNPALFGAFRDAEVIIPVYVFSEKLLFATEHGSRRIGSRRLKFIIESLSDLSEQFGGQILVKSGEPEEVLPVVAKEFGAEAVYANREVATYERDQEEKLERNLPDQVGLKLFWANALYELAELPFPLRELPDVFTPFRKLCEKKANVGPELERPTFNISKELPTAKIPRLEDLGFTQPSDPVNPVLDFTGGETAAIKRLEHYFFKTRNLQTYKETRNGLLGPDYSSKFSPWLAQGCISPRTIYHSVRKYEKEIKKNSSTYWMIFELLWREYFRWVALKYGSALFMQEGIKEVPFEGKMNDEFLEAWKNGATGVPFVDANMRELNETGFMSNRGRQNVASYFVNELNLDWRYGAAYFEEKLIDYDPASNWGNWAYIAGVGNDPVEKRWFNQIGQAKRYDANANYVKTRLPELSALRPEDAHQPWLMPFKELKKHGLEDSRYAKPISLPRRND